MVDGGISMGKTYYQIIAFYDGNKTAREIITDVIVRKNLKVVGTSGRLPLLINSILQSSDLDKLQRCTTADKERTSK